MSTLSPRKRSRSDSDTSSDDDDDFGPALPTATDSKTPTRKRRRKLPYEKLYVSALPSSTRYSKSLMHKDQLFSTHVAPEPIGFVITTSVDGVVKFWKKLAVAAGDGRSGIEFVREFKVNEQDSVIGTGLSCDGALFVSAGSDGRCCVFDVITFDLIATVNIKLDAVKGEKLGCVCWVHRRGAPPLLAVGVGKEVRLYDGRGERNEPLLCELQNLHRTEVVCMGYNEMHDCVVSADASGMIEYWSPANAPDVDKPEGIFKIKSSTDLFDFKKSKPKSVPSCLVMSPRGDQWATWSFPDRRIRLFDFKSGKLLRSYDESIETLMGMQQAGTATVKLEETDFGRRLGVERELDNSAVRPRINVCFDESGNFVCYGSLYGIKVVNTTTNKVMRLYGKDEPFRALNVALYQGAPEKKGVVTVSMAASSNPLLEAAEERDPMLFATAYGKIRFYMFTNEDSIDKANRDVQNEKPKYQGGQKKEERKIQSGNSAVLHTTYGDIFVRLFPDKAPKAVENFVTHARNGYYNSTIFHRVIRKFMIQGGDPLGNGTGGESIWGKEFEDEFSDLKHDKPYTLSMANAGPGTNGSQFFITTEKTTWLDGKHTIFGRAYQGMDVIHQIENTRVVKEKPEEDIKIVNISIS